MHIGILQTGHSPDGLRDRVGDYGNLFQQLLGGNGFTFDIFSVVDGVFPDGPDVAQGWLITGSRHGAYEDHPWIAPLEELIRAIDAARLPLIGVCFGHQIIAQALGGKVEKFAGGWAVGRTIYDTPNGPLALNAWHQDQVVTRPEGARVLGSSPHCENAILAYGDHIWTVQPHPEFDADFIAGLIAERGGAITPPELLDKARNDLDQPVANAAMAAHMAEFFRKART